jgi:hypothetical protein
VEVDLRVKTDFIERPDRVQADAMHRPKVQVGRTNRKAGYIVVSYWYVACIFREAYLTTTLHPHPNVLANVMSDE